MHTQEEIPDVTPSDALPAPSTEPDTEAPVSDPRIKRANAEAARYRVERNEARQHVQDLEARLETLRQELTVQHQQTVESLQQQLDHAEQAAHQEQLQRWRLEAIGRAGLPPELAERLQGDDPDTIAHDAERLAKLFPLRKTTRTGHASQGSAPTRAQQIFNRIEGRSDNLFDLLRQAGHGGGAFGDSSEEE